MGVAPSQLREQPPKSGSHSNRHFAPAAQVSAQLPKFSHFTSHSLPASHTDVQLAESQS